MDGASPSAYFFPLFLPDALPPFLAPLRATFFGATFFLPAAFLAPFAGFFLITLDFELLPTEDLERVFTALAFAAQVEKARLGKSSCGGRFPPAKSRRAPSALRSEQS